jgi:hypothetical protein
MYKDNQLENIWASDLLMACCIWGKSYMSPFRSLQHLHLRSYPSLRYALMICKDSMPSLETLHVIHCGTIRHIIVLGQGHLDDGVLFTELTNIQLHDLPVLEQISKFKMIAPCLETIKIWGCWSCAGCHTSGIILRGQRWRWRRMCGMH